MISFGSSFRRLVEDFGIEVPNVKVVKIGDSKISLNLSGSNFEIDALLESLRNPPSQKELETLETDGIEINFENEVGCSPYSKDIIQTENGMFYKGRRVVLHIAEAFYKNTKYTEVSKLHKYHLHYCDILKQQKGNGNIAKYRISLSKNGEFHYTFGGKERWVVTNQKLNVCTNCLGDFTPNIDYRMLNVSNFSLKDFLDSQPKTVQTGDSPKFLFDGLNLDGMDFDYNSVSAEYHKDWREISIARKKAENYTCQECGWKPNKDKNRRFIHTHHLDKNKGNNLSANLKVLCIQCHFNYHPTLKDTEDYKKFDREKDYDSKYLHSKKGFVTRIELDKDKKGIYRKFIEIDNKLKALVYSNRDIYDEVKVNSRVEYIEKDYKGKKEAGILEIL